MDIKAGRPTKNGALEEPLIENAPTVLDMGIIKKHSSSFQRLAKLPEELFEETIEALDLVTTYQILKKVQGHNHRAGYGPERMVHAGGTL